MPTNDDHQSSTGPGFIMMLMIFAGFVIGLFMHQSSLGFLVGVGAAFVYAGASWLITRRNT